MSGYGPGLKLADPYSLEWDYYKGNKAVEISIRENGIRK